VKASRLCATAPQSSSTVRAAVFLSNALSLEKAISMGLKACPGQRSGLGAIRRQVEQPRPGGFDCLAHAGDLVGRQVVHDDDIAGLEFGHQHLFDPRFRGGRRKRGMRARAWGRRAASTLSARPSVIRRQRACPGPRSGMVVFQCPCGTAARQRWPFGDHPRSRAIFVLAPVSSMKISLSGSRSSWPSNQSWRFARTSGRCCSLAWPVFF